TQPGGRNGEHSGTRAHIQHELALKIDRLQCGQAQSGGGVVAGPKTHRRWDDDGSGLETRGSGPGAREDGDTPDRDWRQVLLRPSRPVFVVDVDGRDGKPLTESGGRGVARRGRGEEYAQSGVSLLDSRRSEVVNRGEQQIGLIGGSVERRPAL